MCRRLHNEELHSLCRSSNIIRVIKSRRLRWVGHVARMDEDSCTFKMLTGKLTRMIKSRILRWADHVARMEEGRNAFKILTGKPTRKRPLGRSKHRYNNIRMDLKEICINTKNWVDSVQDRLTGEPL